MRYMDASLIPTRSQCFYRAFYRWALLNSSTHASPTTLKHHHAHLHTSTCRRAGAATLIRKFKSRDSPPQRWDNAAKPAKGGREKHRRPLGPVAGPAERSVAEQEEADDDVGWDKAAVQSSAERPFDTLEPWEQVIRYHSFAGIMLQTAVPAEAVHQLWTRYGTEGRIKATFGAAVEIGQPETRTSDDGTAVQIRSVLISGMHDKVRSFRKALRTLRSDRGESSLNATSELSLPHITDFQPWMFDAKGRPISENDRGFDTLRPWECVLRQRSLDDGNIMAEMAAPCREWGAMISGFNLRQLSHDNRASIRWTRPKSDGLVSAVISGQLKHVQHALSVLRTTRDNLAPLNRLHSEQHSSNSAHVPPEAESIGADPEEQSKAQAALSEDMKKALRTLTHPVAVVTSVSHRGKQSFRGPHFATALSTCRGVTVSSFNTITLSPSPMISLNLKVPSRTWDAILMSGRFCVHLLAASPTGAKLAHTFTKPYEQPDEPFHRLRRAGYALFFRDHGKYAVLGWNGVVAVVLAVLDREKCVHVGDHVVVVAKVSTIRHNLALEEVEENQRMALTYAMRGYRDVGTSIEPAELVEMADGEDSAHDMTQGVGSTIPADEAWLEMDSEEEGVSEVPHDVFQDGETAAADKGTRVEVEAGEEALDDALEHSEFATESYFEQMARADNDIKVAAPEAELEEGTAERQDEPTHENDMRKGVEHSSPSSEGAQQPLTTIANAGVPNRGGGPAWGLSAPSRSSFSTGAFPTRRTYSSFATKHPRSPNPEAQVTDSSLLSLTVAEFLGELPDAQAPRPRMRGMLRAKHEAEHASRQLEQSLARGTLTEDMSAQLEGVIERNERRIVRKLAQTSARDLKNVLDTGRVVDDRRTQWLESSIEKGLAVLLEEAKRLRVALDEKAITLEGFRTVKAKLEQEHEVLNTEVMRLRQMVDEEGEDGGVAESRTERAAQGKETDAFDGFRGNV